MENNPVKNIFILNTISFILLLITFIGLYTTANNINNEISFRNYLYEKGNRNIMIDINGTPIVNNIAPEQLSFPLWLQIIMGVFLFIILEIYRISFTHYINKYRNKKIIVESISGKDLTKDKKYLEKIKSQNQTSNETKQT